MFLEQSGYNGFLWPTHCISFSWSLLLLWLPSLLLWNIPTHYLQPECVCKCSPTSGSAHFSLPALKKIHQSLSLKDDASSGNKTCSGSRSHHKRRAGSVKGHCLSPQSSFQAHTTWRVMGDKTCYYYPSQARLTRRSWVCDENFSSPWDQSCRSRKTDTDCWVTGSGLRYWVAGVHRWWWLLDEGWSLRATVDRHFSIDLLYHEDESYWVKIITFGHPPHGQRNPGYHPLWVFLPNCLVNAYSSFLWVGSEKKSSSNIAISLNIKCGHLFYSIYSLSIQLLL